jgi:hypothetical protein
MRRSTIVVVFLMLLLAGCGANTTTESTREATGDTTARSAQSEATIRVTAVPEKTTSATVAPAGWVSAIGDSVMLGAVEALQREIPNLSAIDAQGCLQTPAAIQILRERRAAGQLGDVVVVHIGNNGPLSADIFDEMMQVLAGVRKILVLNLTVPPNVSDPIAVPNNAVLAARVQRYPNAALVDWHSASSGHPEFFGEDGIHLTLQGAQAYADLITTYLGSDLGRDRIENPIIAADPTASLCHPGAT